MRGPHVPVVFFILSEAVIAIIAPNGPSVISIVLSRREKGVSASGWQYQHNLNSGVSDGWIEKLTSDRTLAGILRCR